MSHSPSPWHHAPQGASDGYIEDANGNLICQLFDNTDDGTDPLGEEQGDFNLALILAAPELLEELHNALPFVEDALNDPSFKRGAVKKAADRIRALIAKACKPSVE